MTLDSGDGRSASASSVKPATRPALSRRRTAPRVYADKVTKAPLFPQAVLWDMDGTLVETEQAWVAAETAIVASFGGLWTAELGAANVGGPVSKAASAMLDAIRAGGADPGPSLDRTEMERLLLSRVEKQVRRELPMRPGAAELMVALSRCDVPMALVTNSPQSMVNAVIDGIEQAWHQSGGTGSPFTLIVTPELVYNPKPAPDMYQYAAAKLGVDPRRCVVLEDSPVGVASAEAAGCLVVAVPFAVPLHARHRVVIVESLTLVDPQLLSGLLNQAHQPAA